MPGPLRPGIFVLGLLFTGGLAADCKPLGDVRSVGLAAVTDGDSLRLSNGQRVRLLGINAPELGRDGRPAEPLAEEARQALQAQLKDREVVYLQAYGHDRYGRVLAEVFTRQDGGHVGETLLSKGLARAVVVPPRWRSDDCLWRTEEAAREQSRGLWSTPPLPSQAATAKDQGFVVMTGRVESVSHSRHAVWVDLDGDVVIKIAESDWPYFGNEDWLQWPGREVELRGWLRSRRAKPGFASLKMDLRHPAMMRWMPRLSEDGRSKYSR